MSVQVARPLRYAEHVVLAEDEAAVLAVLRSAYLTQGPMVPRFEAALAECVGARHAVAFSSGTTALHAACSVAGVGPGHEVITSPLTFVATANSALYVGADVVFADVLPDTLTLDPEKVRAAITDRTRAIITVDYAGGMSDYDSLRQIAQEHGLALVSDACHALGATYKGERHGDLAHAAVYSHHPAKHVTTGEGGSIVTNSEALAERARLFREHGRVDGEMVSLGYNYRLSDIAAALGLSQISRLDANLARRREIAAYYTERLQDVVQTPYTAPGCEHAFHLYPIQVNNRDVVRARLAEQGVGAQIHYPPVTAQPYYRQRFGTRPEDTPVAYRASQRLLSLPMHCSLTDEDTERVIAAVRQAVQDPAPAVASPSP